MGPGRAQDRTQARVWMAPPRDSNRLLGLSDTSCLVFPAKEGQGSFPYLFGFPCACLCQEFLAYLAAFPFFSRNVGRQREKILFSFVASFSLCREKARKQDQVFFCYGRARTIQRGTSRLDIPADAWAQASPNPSANRKSNRPPILTFLMWTSTFVEAFSKNIGKEKFGLIFFCSLPLGGQKGVCDMSVAQMTHMPLLKPLFLVVSK